MPVLDGWCKHRKYSILHLKSIAGVGAIQMIRNVENQRYGEDKITLKEDGPRPLSTPKRANILALSGLASKEDKLRAFSAGVDG
jgi:CheY-like chemotaxis protein